MASTVAVTYVGGFGSIYVPSLGITVERGKSIRVLPDVAGTVPTADDPGTGLLAQPSNWQLTLTETD